MSHSGASFLFAAALAFAACGDGVSAVDAGVPDTDVPDTDGLDTSEVTPAGCSVIDPTSCVEPSPRYTDVEPIFEARCVECHAGVPGGSWPLTSYSHIVLWQNEIRDQLTACAMPPADAGVRISAEESETILMWLRCGVRQ